MEYYILTESEFFNLINRNDETVNLTVAYNDFIRTMIGMCTDSEADRNDILLALAYAENELQFHRTQHVPADRGHIGFLVRKALSFIRKMQRYISINHVQVPPLSKQSNPTNVPPKAATVTPALRWTGNAIDLVEMIYGINEMGCINRGEITLKELAPVFYSFFDVETKDCYRFYTDIKRRKNDSRTYFLDRMREKLNEKMRRDDELECMRR